MATKVFTPDIRVKGWHEQMPAISCAEIEKIANKRPLTAKDFEPYIGSFQWAVFDADLYPKEYGVNAWEEANIPEVVGQFFIRRTDGNDNKVRVGLVYDPYGLRRYSYIDCDFDADELAIRIMEA